MPKTYPLSTIEQMLDTRLLLGRDPANNLVQCRRAGVTELWSKGFYIPVKLGTTMCPPG